MPFKLRAFYFGKGAAQQILHMIIIREGTKIVQKDLKLIVQKLCIIPYIHLR